MELYIVVGRGLHLKPYKIVNLIFFAGAICINYLFPFLCVQLLYLLLYLVECTDTDLDHQVEDIRPPLFVSASCAIPSDIFFSELNEEEDLSSVICVETETEKFQICKRAESNNPMSSKKKAETQKRRSIRLVGIDHNLPQQTKKKTICSSLPGRKKRIPLRFRENCYTKTPLSNNQNSSLVNKKTLTMSLKSVNTKATTNNSLNKKIVTRKVVKNEKEERSSNIDITKKHIKQKFSWNTKTPGEYQCNHCKKKYQYIRGLRLHQKYTCSDSKFKQRFVCPYCSRKLNLKPSLRNHVHSCHKEKFVEWYEKNYSDLKYLQCYINS